MLMRRWGMRAGCLGCIALMAVGCSSRQSSLLLERHARGPMTEEGAIAQARLWQLDPISQTKNDHGLDITVTYASPDYLRELFNRKEVFGNFAGANPFFAEHLVFYVTLGNHGPKRVRIDPVDFVLLDDQGNQYQVVTADYVTALAESKAPVSTFTRGVLSEARPGYFGIGLPVGKVLAQSQQRFALLKLSTLQAGSLHPDVVYDGLVAFWAPHTRSKRIRLLLGNIKTDFDSKDWPQTAFDVTFEFSVISPP